MKTAAGALVVLALASCKPSASSPTSAPATDAGSGSVSGSVSASASASVSASGSVSASASASASARPPPAFVELASGGVGFDDLVWVPELRKIVAPAGGTGELALIDVDTFAVTPIGGFSRATFTGGHRDSITSAAYDGKHLLVTDRTTKEIVAVDPTTKAIVSRSKLGADPDYVRFVKKTGEAWVTEPDAEKIEIFQLEGDTLRATATIDVKGGPESLVVSEKTGVAYTNLWKGSTLTIDLAKRSITRTVPNGCTGARGLALDDDDALVFVGCSEGRVTILDAKGALAGTAKTGAGVDIVAFDPKKRHVYAPAAKSGKLSVFHVGNLGGLEPIGETDVPLGTHCVIADDRVDVFLCDPSHGRLLIQSDHFAPIDR